VLAGDEATVGRKFDISYHFHTVGDTFPTADELSEVATGHILHINIEVRPYTYAQIASGAEDAGLTEQALGVASIGAPVFVTFSHEPDVARKSAWGTPADYVAAWRHVHDLFVANGATNAVWVWVMTGWYPNFPRYGSYYPGNDDVDWISWEAYSTTVCKATRNVLNGTFADAAGPEYQWLHDGAAAAAGIDVSKPEMISEYGAVYDNGNPGAQAAWYAGIPELLKTQFPDIKAVAKWDNPGGTCQDEMSGSPLTIAGMTAAGHDPYVNQTVPSTPPPPPTTPPLAASFTSSCSGLTCSVDASGSTTPDTITSYAWTFGDGASGAGAAMSHSYSAGGNETVTLTVTDAEGDTASTSQTVAPSAAHPAFVAVAATAANATSESVKVPAAVTAGDGMLLFATGAGSSALTAPAGWAQVATSNTASIRTTLWERVATSTDPGSTVTVSFPAIYRGSTQLLAYSGTSSADPVAAAATATAGTAGSSYRTPATTVPVSGDIVVAYWACKSSGVSAWTMPAGVTLRSGVYNAGGGRITAAVADSPSTATGAAGGLTATTDASASAFAAWTVVVG
jgi:hypothetical protein